MEQYYYERNNDEWHGLDDSLLKRPDYVEDRITAVDSSAVQRSFNGDYQRTEKSASP